MVASKLMSFGGQIPLQDDRLLPEQQAALAQNIWLTAGSLQGFRSFVHLVDGPAGTSKAFRIPNGEPDADHLEDATWWFFQDPDTDVVRSPVSGDAFDRYYATSPSMGPWYNTKARIASGAPPYVLGIPAPATAPGVSTTGGSGSVLEARSYVYTWVSGFGEEGPPSPPTTFTAQPSANWNLTFTAPTPADTANRDLMTTRIYRTVTTASGGVNYFWVADVPITTLSYTDTRDSATVSAGNPLISTGFIGPPSDLKGWVSMPNGMIVGWCENQIWFCEPYYPHAWPPAYTLSVDFEIVGLGVVGQTLVVLTEGFPYAASGIHPSSMALAKIGTHEPCLSRASIVSTAQGVLYASPNGLTIAAYGVVQNASLNLISRDRWNNMLHVDSLRAAQLGQSYYCWGSVTPGCYDPGSFDTSSFEQTDYTGALTGALISLLDMRLGWTTLANDEPISSVMTDFWSGEILLCINGGIYWFNISSTQRDQPYLWRSKVFQTTKLMNFGAIRVWFTVPDTTPPQNAIRNTDVIQTLDDGQYGILRVYADDLLILCREIRKDGELLREPSGYKAGFWQFEIEARVPVYNFEAATNVKELGTV